MKKYGVVKVRNPSSDGHIVRLLPLQSFQIICTKFSESDKYDVSVLGNFLVVTDVLEKDNLVIFKIEQKYDVSNWVEISDLFSGNVVLSRKFKDTDDKIRLCVYCSDVKSNGTVITVVNPEDALIKMEPHQVIQIVTYSKEIDAKWSIINSNPALKCIKCETVVNDYSDIYDKNSIFCAEPRSNKLKRNDSLSIPDDFLLNEILGIHSVTETHFWFLLKETEASYLYEKPDDSYYGGSISIKEEVDDINLISKIEFTINVRSKNRMKSDYFDSVNFVAQNWKDRVLSYSRQCILNPNLFENLSISDSENSFYVEIPNPSVYFSDLKDDERWKPSDCKVQTFELKSRHINGQRIQRFLIIGIAGMDQDLGKVIFTSASGKTIILNFWKITGGLIPATSYQPVKSEYSVVKNKKTSLNFSSIVEMEIELEIVQDGLIDGESTPLSEISSFDYNSYSEYGYSYSYMRP